jgi:hypothetical protein
VACVGWPPVIATMALSRMKTLMLTFSRTASSSGARPECVKVPSPMTHSAGVMPACAAPMAMPIDEPMHRHEWMAASGSSAPSE